MSSKDRLCVTCGSYICRRLVKSQQGPLHFGCWLRTGGPFFKWVYG